MLKADPHAAVRNAFLPSFNFIIISRACGSSWSVEKKKNCYQCPDKSNS